jgi:hypothetical protein
MTFWRSIFQDTPKYQNINGAFSRILFNLPGPGGSHGTLVVLSFPECIAILKSFFHKNNNNGVLVVTKRNTLTLCLSVVVEFWFEVRITYDHHALPLFLNGTSTPQFRSVYFVQTFPGLIWRTTDRTGWISSLPDLTEKILARSFAVLVQQKPSIYHGASDRASLVSKNYRVFTI